MESRDDTDVQIVTFRSACFPQDRWSWTILSGTANDRRNRRHVVLDFSQTSTWARSLTKVNPWSRVIFRKYWINKGDHSAYTVGYTVVRKRTYENMYQCRTDGKAIHKKKETQMTHGWTDALERYLEHFAKIDISHIATAEHRGRYQNLLYLRAFGENLNGPPSASRPGYQEPKKCQKGMQEQWRKDVGIGFIPTSARKRLNDQLHLDTKKGSWPKYEMLWILRGRKANLNRSAIFFVYLDPELKLVGLTNLDSNWDSWNQRNWQDDKWDDNW